MQLEQHIFSLYRILLRLPRTLFIILTALALGAVIIHIHYIYSTQIKLQDVLSPSTGSFNECLIEYAMKKHQEVIQKTQTKKNQSQSQRNSQIINLNFLQQLTILHIRIDLSNEKYTYKLNYDYSYGNNTLPLFLLTDTQPFQNLKTNDSKYLKDHGITFDLITVPHLNIKPPVFSLYFNQRMLLNELLMQYLRNTILSFQQDFLKYKIKNNITNATINYSSIQLTFYFGSENQNNEINQLKYYSINFNTFIAWKIFPIFFQKIYFSLALFILLMIISILIGLIVRYVIILFFTLFLVLSDKCFRQSWGWTHQYLIILYNRYRTNPLSTFKIIIFYIASNVAIHAFFIFGTYCIIKKLIYPSIPLIIDQYKLFYLKICFLIELFHFIFSRSRVTIKLYPIISFSINFLMILICSLNQSGFTILLLNINMLLQITILFSFILIEKIIMDDNDKGLINEFCPSLSKPRMLFYAGYDISWEKSLPPLWTYFTKWFDYSYFNDNQKSLLEKDYQLLYGRMLGLNQRQEIPQEENELSEGPIVRQPSYEMNLIQQ